MSEYQRLKGDSRSHRIFNKLSKLTQTTASKLMPKKLSSKDVPKDLSNESSKVTIPNIPKLTSKPIGSYDLRRLGSFSSLNTATPPLTDDESVITTFSSQDSTIQCTNPTTQLSLADVLGSSSRCDSPFSEKDIDSENWESVPLINRKLNRTFSSNMSGLLNQSLKSSSSYANLRQVASSQSIRPRYNSLRAVHSASQVLNNRIQKPNLSERCLSCCNMRVEARKLNNVGYNAYEIKTTPPPGSITICVNCSELTLQMDSIDLI